MGHGERACPRSLEEQRLKWQAKELREPPGSRSPQREREREEQLAWWQELLKESRELATAQQQTVQAWAVKR
jgi:hypothetical protein